MRLLLRSQWVSAEGKTLNWVKAAAGEQVLWEPGCTYTLPELRVVNNGNLALKYKLVISGIQGDAELNNVIDWTMTLDGAAYTLGEEHHLAAKNGETVDADVLTISGKMQESAGNDYMNKSIDGIAITVVAAQDTVESDSFNNTYDANAEYPAMPYVTFDGCTFNNYTNTTYANNSNPIWWRAATGYWGTGADESVHSLKEFTFVNNKVASTRPVKIERIGWNCTAGITILDNTFDISKQAGDSATKNMAINIGQKDNTSKFILTDDGNTISASTASLYTAALGSGSNQYVAVSGSKVLDRNGNDKVITAMVWKTTTGETFEMKTID